MCDWIPTDALVSVTPMAVAAKYSSRKMKSWLKFWGLHLELVLRIGQPSLFLKNMFIDFRERDRGKSESERNGLVASCTCSLGMCSDQESNPQPFDVAEDSPTN